MNRPSRRHERPPILGRRRLALVVLACAGLLLGGRHEAFTSEKQVVEGSIVRILGVTAYVDLGSSDGITRRLPCEVLDPDGAKVADCTFDSVLSARSTVRAVDAAVELVPGYRVRASVDPVAADPGPDPGPGSELGTTFNRRHQMDTYNHIEAVGAAMLAWAVDQIEAAPAATISTRPESFPEIAHRELEALLVPTYIREVRALDQWGNPYDYRLNVEDPLAVTVMLIRSAGSDGRFSDAPYEAGLFDPGDWHEDIVWADGRFVRAPRFPDQASTPAPRSLAVEIAP